MNPHRYRRLASLLLVPLLLPAAAAAGPPPSPAPEASKPSSRTATPRLPEGLEVEASRILELPEADGYVLEGAVSIRSGRSRIQADRIEMRQGRYLEASGDVLLVWGRNRISGARMTYDLETERGAIDDATGQVEPEFFFVARRAEKIGDDAVLLDHATITTCTQPVPYWSFSVAKAKIRLDHYAHLSHIALRVRRAPIFYLPYLVWPAKRDRAAGLLLPSFGSNRDRGEIVALPLYLPMGPSAELTLTAEYFTLAGLGGGADLAFLPNRRGAGRMSGFFIRDEVAETDRYRFAYNQTQEFDNGFRMVADVNRVSDFDYFNDFERDLRLVSSPTILTRVEFSRSGAWTSLNVRELRREQLLSNGTSQTQETLPEVEWRGRSRRLGRTPLYLSFESSLASISQSSVQLRTAGDAESGYETFRFPLESDYFRGDVFPTISAPFSPVPWLDVTPSVSSRYTIWTQHQRSETVDVEVGDGSFDVPVTKVVDDRLARSVSSAAVEVVGPKLFRIFERSGDGFSPRYKHVIEPWVSYVYQQAFARSSEILSYDDVDTSRGATNQLTYGVRTRLFAQRPRSLPPPAPGTKEAVLLPSEGSAAPREAEEGGAGDGAAPEKAEPKAPMEPVEIASIEIRQGRSFGRDLTERDVDGDGVLERSRFSAIETVGRFNPTRTTSLDLRTSYDILLGKTTSLSLSGNLRGDWSRSSFSFVRTAATTAGGSSSTQVRFSAGVDLLGKKLRIDVDGSLDVDERRFPDQRWILEYYTQCCGFLAEWFRRDYAANDRGEFRFTVDLRGVGKLLDIHQ